MKHFELLFLDRHECVVTTRTFIGHDDLAALAEAERLSVAHAIEIRQGLRRVARVKRGNLALVNTDRLAG